MSMEILTAVAAFMVGWIFGMASSDQAARSQPFRPVPPTARPSVPDPVPPPAIWVRGYQPRPTPPGVQILPPPGYTGKWPVD